MTDKAYDVNGDATLLTYDDENRLIDINNPLLGLETALVYDGLGRLRIRQEYSGTGQSPLGAPIGGGTLMSETHYIYDGWRVIQERNASNTPQVTCTRGSDLSGSMQGAGGIGGLLSRESGYSGTTGNWSTHNYYFADGSGNITYLESSSQAMVASYRYDPFGNTISTNGTQANANVYRFSSKEILVNSGLYSYGFRFYDPSLQRWLNRDPIGEIGGVNLYAYVANGPVNSIDGLGLQEADGVEVVPPDRPEEGPIPGQNGRLGPTIINDPKDLSKVEPPEGQRETRPEAPCPPKHTPPPMYQPGPRSGPNGNGPPRTPLWIVTNFYASSPQPITYWPPPPPSPGGLCSTCGINLPPPQFPPP